MNARVILVSSNETITDTLNISDGDQVVITPGETFLVVDENGNPIDFTSRWVGEELVVNIEDEEGETSFSVLGLPKDSAPVEEPAEEEPANGEDPSTGEVVPEMTEEEGGEESNDDPNQADPVDISFGDGADIGSSGSGVENLVGGIVTGGGANNQLIRKSGVSGATVEDVAAQTSGAVGFFPQPNLGSGGTPPMEEPEEKSDPAPRPRREEEEDIFIPRPSISQRISDSPDESDRPMAKGTRNGEIRVTSVDTGDTGKGGQSVFGSKGELIVNNDGTFEYFTDLGSGKGRDVYIVEYPVVVDEETGEEAIVAETLIFDWKGGNAKWVAPDLSNGVGQDFFDDDDNELPDVTADPDPTDEIESPILVTSLDNADLEDPDRVGGINESVNGEHGFIVVSIDGTYDYVMDPDYPIEEGTTEDFTLTYIDENGKKTVEILSIEANMEIPVDPETGEPIPGAEPELVLSIHELESGKVGEGSDPDPSDPPIDPEAVQDDIDVKSLDTGNEGDGGDLVDGSRGTFVFNEDGSYDYDPEMGSDPGIDTFTVTYPIEDSENRGETIEIVEVLRFETDEEGVVTELPPTVSNEPGENFYTEEDNKKPADRASVVIESVDNEGSTGGPGELVEGDNGFLIFNLDGSFDYITDPDKPLPEGETETYLVKYTDENGKETVETLTFIGKMTPVLDIDGFEIPGEFELTHCVFEPVSLEIGGGDDPDSTDPVIDPAAVSEEIEVESLATGETGNAGELVDGGKGTLLFNEDGTFDYLPDPDATPGVDQFVVTYPVEGSEDPISETLTFLTKDDGTVEVVTPDETIDGSFFDEEDNKTPADESSIVVKSIESGDEHDAGTPVHSSNGALVFNTDGSYDYLVNPDSPLPVDALDVFTITYTDESGEVSVESLTFIGTEDGSADLHVPVSLEVGGEADPDPTDPKVDPEADPDDIVVVSLDTEDTGIAGEIVDGPRGDLLFNEDGTFDYITEPGAEPGIDTFTVTYPSVDGGDPVTEILRFETKEDGTVEPIAPEVSIDGTFYDDPDNKKPADDSDIIVKSVESGEEAPAGSPVDSPTGTLVYNTDGTYDYAVDPDAPLGEGDLDVFTITYTDEAGEKAVETLTFVGDGLGGAEIHDPLSEEIGGAGDPDPTDPKVDPEASPEEIIVKSLDTEDEGIAGELVDGPRGDLIFNEDGTFDYVADPKADPGIDTFTVTYPPVDGGDPVTEIIRIKTKDDGTTEMIAPDETIDGTFYDDPDNKKPADDSDIIVKSVESGEEAPAGSPVDSAKGTLVFNTNGTYDYIVDPDAPLAKDELDVFTITYTDEAGEVTVETLTFIGDGEGSADLHAPLSEEIGGEGDPDTTDPKVDPEASPEDIIVTSLDTEDTGIAGELVDGPRGDLIFNEDGTFDYIPEPGVDPGIDTFTVTYPPVDGGDPVTEIIRFETKDDGTTEMIAPDETIDGTFYDDPDNKKPGEDSDITVKSVASGEEGPAGTPVDSAKGTLVFNTNGTYDYIVDPDAPLAKDELDVFTITYTDEAGELTVETLTFIGDGEGSAAVHEPLSAEIGGTGDPDETDPLVDPSALPEDIIVTSLDTEDTGIAGDIVDGPRGDLIFNEDGTFDYIPEPGADPGIDTFTVTYPPVGGGDPVTETLSFETAPEGVVTLIAPDETIDGDFYDDPDNKKPAEDSDIIVKSVESGEEALAGTPVESGSGTLVYNADGSFDYLSDPDSPLAEGELDVFTISYTDVDGKETVETLTFVGDGEGSAVLHEPFSAVIGGEGDPDETDRPIDPEATKEDIVVTSLDTEDSGPAGDMVDGPRGDLIFNEDGTFDYIPEPGAEPGIDTFTVEYPVVGGKAPVVETLLFETLEDGTVVLVEPADTIEGDFFDDEDNPTPGVETAFEVASVETGGKGDAGDPVKGGHGTLIFNPDGTYDYILDPETPLSEDGTDEFTITYTDEDGNETVETLTFTGDGAGGATEVEPTSEAIEDADDTDNPPVAEGTTPDEIKVVSLATADEGTAGELVDGGLGTLVFNPDGTFDFVLSEDAPEGEDTFFVTYPSEDGPVTETLTFVHDGEGDVEIEDPVSGIIGGAGDPDDTDPLVAEGTEPGEIEVSHPASGEEGEALEPVKGDFGTFVVNPDGTFDYVPDPDAPTGSEDTFLVTFPTEDGPITETFTFEFPVDGEAILVGPDSTGDLDLPEASPDIDGFFPISITSEETGDRGRPGEPVVGDDSDIVFNEDGTFDINVHPDAEAGPGDTEVFEVSYFTPEGVKVVQDILVEYDGDGGANVLPFVTDAAGTIAEDVASVSGEVTTYDVDSDDPVSYSLASGEGAMGDLAIDPEGGGFTYTLDNGLESVQSLAAGETATEEFTYITTDSDGGTTAAAITITIQGANDAPIGSDDNLTLSEDAPLIVGGSDRAGEGDGVLANDFDIDASDGHRVSSITIGGVPVSIPTGGEATRSLGGGVLTMRSDGGYTFVPGDGYHYLASGEEAVESFTYTMMDDEGATSEATVTFTIEGVNDAVTAAPVEAEISEDLSATVDPITEGVLDIDTTDEPFIVGIDGEDPSEDPVTLDSGAIVTLKPDGTIDYDPAGSFESLPIGETAIDTFTYTVSDGHSTATETVTVTVVGENDNPIAVVDNIEVDEDGLAIFDPRSNDSDVDGDSLTATIAAGEFVATGVPIELDSGAILLPRPGGVFAYDTNDSFNHLGAGETAIDTFTYTVEDGKGGSDTATISFTVKGANDAPDVADDTVSLAEDDGSKIFNVLLNDSDADGDALTVSGLGAGGDDSITLPGSGSIVAITPTGTLQLTLGEAAQTLGFGETLIETFTYTVTDGVASEEATVTVTIDGENDAPVIEIDPEADPTTPSLDERIDDDRDVKITGKLGSIASDVDATDSLTFSTDDSGEYGELELDPDGDYKYTLDGENPDVDALNAGETLTETFTVVVEDEHGATDETDFVVTIVGKNDTPEISIDEIDLREDTPLTLTTAMVDTVDPDDDPSELVYTFDVAPESSGYFEVDGDDEATSFTHADLEAGKVKFIPVGEGEPSITLTVTDSGGATDTVSLDIAFANVNDAPVLALTPFDIDEGARVNLSEAHIDATDSDHADSELTLTPLGVTGGSFVFAGTDSPASSFTLADIKDGLIDFVHDGSETTPAFTMKVTDGALASDTATSALTLIPDNDIPEITVNTLTLDEGERVKLTTEELEAEDPDDGPADLTYTASGVTGGRFERADGTPITTFTRAELLAGAIYFAHDGGEAAPEYTITVADVAGASDVSDLSVSFSKLNDAPTTAPDVDAFLEDGGGIDGSVLANDLDPDSTMVISEVNGSGSNVGSDVEGTYGTLKLNSNGSYTYVQRTDSPNLDEGEEVVETFTYKVSDGDGGFGTSTLTITVTGANDAPHVVADIEDIVIEVEGVDTGVGGGGGEVADAPDFVEVSKVGSEAFARGNYVEIGIRDNGTFGASAGSRPSGYHNPRKTLFGFIANPDKNDWASYDGDFFSPGTPEEGFGLKIGGSQFNNNTVGGLEQIAGSVTGVSEAVTGGISMANIEWSGSAGGVNVDRTISVSSDGLYILMKTTLTNTTGGDMSNVFWHHNVDPDNNQSIGHSYVTTNRVLAQAGDGKSGTASGDFDSDGKLDDFTYDDSHAIVLASQNKGGDTSNVSLVAADDRARVTSGGFSNRSSDAIWNGTGFIANEGGVQTADKAISIAFKFDEIAAGESVDFVYAYNLVADPSEAFLGLEAVSSPIALNLTAFFDDVNLDDDASTLDYAVTLVDGSPLPEWLVFDSEANTLKGTPPAGAVALTVKVTATDQHGASTFQTFNIGTPPGEAPTFDAGPDPVVLDWGEPISYESGPLWFDADGDTLTYSAFVVGEGVDAETVDLATLSPIDTIGLSINPFTGEVTGTPTDTSNGFIIVASDGTGITLPGRSSVITFNESPDAATDTGTTGEDIGVALNILDNDTDAEGDTISLAGLNGEEATAGIPISLDSGATVTLLSDGTIYYDPNGAFDALGDGESALDTFTYTISDSKSGPSEGTVNVTVTGEDDLVNNLAFQSTDGVLNVMAFDPVTASFENTQVGVNPAGIGSYNAMAFNSADNLLYARDGSNIISIDPQNGEAAVVHAGLALGGVAADFSGVDGNLYMVNGGGWDIYDIEAGTRSHVGFTGGSPSPADVAYDPVTGLFWGATGSTVYSISETGETTTYTGAISLAGASGGVAADGSGWGGAFADKNGNIALLNNGSGRIYQIDTDTGTGSFLVQGKPSGSNDGAADFNFANDLFRPHVVLDQDSSTGGNPRAAYNRFVSGGAAVNIADSDAYVIDFSDANLTRMTVTLVDAKAGDSLALGSSHAGITASTATVDGNIVLTLSGSATQAAYTAALKDVQFSNSEADPDVSPRFIYVNAEDGTGTSSEAQATIFVVDAAGPVVIDMDGDGIEVLTAEEGIAFDLDGDGELEQTSWAGNDDAVLVFDENGNNDVDGRSEVVFTDRVEGAETDLEGLLHFDSNGDNRLDAGDEEFAKFKLWQDADGDGNVDEGEMQTLEEAGIESLDLISDGISYSAAGGDVLVHGEAAVNYADGTTGVAADAEFNYAEMLTSGGGGDAITAATADGGSIEIESAGDAAAAAASTAGAAEADDAGVSAPVASDGAEEEAAAVAAAAV